MGSKTTTVKLQEDGSCTIPANVRRALDLYGESEYVEITVHTDE